MRKLIWVGSFSFSLLIAAVALQGTAQSISAIEHTLSVIQRPDGQFDVTCIDGITEVKSQAEVLANRLCTHLKTFDGRWTLIEGGMDNGSRLCDLDMYLIRSDYSVLKLRAGFAPPCSTSMVESQQCNGLLCSLQLGEKYFSFDFTVTSQVTLTRLEDGFTAVYRGSAGNGRGSSGTARLAELQGVQNILQSSNDNGTTWLSVCDDGFGPEEAAVACRELGHGGTVSSVTTGISVRNDSTFGWDDLSCTGPEIALGECVHNDWGEENCGEGEHVQLVCAP